MVLYRNLLEKPFDDEGFPFSDYIKIYLYIIVLKCKNCMFSRVLYKYVENCMFSHVLISLFEVIYKYSKY